MPEATSESTLPEDVRRQRKEILRLAHRRGAHNVRVFGSALRGEADQDSDIDLLVDLEPDRNLLDLGGLQMDLQELLERPVDLKTESSLRRDIRERVLREAVSL